MKVFVTGATGFIGTVTVQELLDHGHQVIGLARSDASAKKLQDQGAEVIRGDLEDLETLKKGAIEADGVAHLGFIHDFTQFEKSCQTDRKAIEAMVSTMHGTNKPFIAAFGTLMLPNDHPATEKEKQAPHPPFGIRAATQDFVTDQAVNGVATMALRLSPTVHGQDDGAFIPAIIESARKAGKSIYIEEGKNVWPATHRKDAASLIRLALENPQAGAVLHAVHEQGVPFKDIATSIGKHLDIPIISTKADDKEATSHLGFFAGLVGAHNPVSSEWTRKTFNWTPSQKGLIADMEDGHYFAKGQGATFVH